MVRDIMGISFCEGRGLVGVANTYQALLEVLAAPQRALPSGYFIESVEHRQFLCRCQQNPPLDIASRQ